MKKIKLEKNKTPLTVEIESLLNLPNNTVKIISTGESIEVLYPDNITLTAGQLVQVKIIMRKVNDYT